MQVYAESFAERWQVRTPLLRPSTDVELLPFLPRQLNDFTVQDAVCLAY